jgi:hypothetical protein
MNDVLSPLEWRDGVLRLLDQRVGLVDDHDPAPRLERAKRCLIDHRPYRLDLDRAAVAGREHDDVGVHATGNAPARRALAAGVALELAIGARRRAVDRLSYRDRHATLADAGRPGKEQRRRQRATRHRPRQQRHEPPMADDVTKGHLAILMAGRAGKAGRAGRGQPPPSTPSPASFQAVTFRSIHSRNAVRSVIAFFT